MTFKLHIPLLYTPSDSKLAEFRRLVRNSERRMGRGVSAGGGQSSLGYLFGGGEAAANNSPAAQNHEKKISSPAPQQPADNSKQVAAGILSSNANNYVRADGQNCGNFLTERRSTKVQAAPGGGSSLGYLFGGGGSSN